MISCAKTRHLMPVIVLMCIIPAFPCNGKSITDGNNINNKTIIGDIIFFITLIYTTKLWAISVIDNACHRTGIESVRVIVTVDLAIL